MHSFCCVSTVPDRTQATPPSRQPTPHSSLTEIVHVLSSKAMTSYQSLSASASSDHSRGSPSSSNQNGRPIRRSATLESLCGFASLADQHGIAGVLYKWVNYGRGWRPRWFVLKDGVLSYYKIHGSNKIIVNKDTEKGSKVIGEVSMRRISRNGNSQSRQRIPVGEIHLKVASVRESKSDDKRFSIYTGTKRMHLRAESREDRVKWMKALQTVKEMFPRVSNSDFMLSVENEVVVSTEKLRQRLLEECVSENAIQESEHIMKSELSALHNQVVVLKQKQLLLLDTLRNLETEKVDLENTLVDESQRQLKEQEASASLKQDKSSEISASNSDDHDRDDAAEEESDDDDNAFFDSLDFLSSSSFRSNGSNYRRSPLHSDDEETADLEDCIDPIIRSAGSNYPYVRRRKKLPDPVEKEKGVSLWSMIKDNIGKDLTKVCLPVYFNEPLSSLQKCFEDLEYSYLIDRAYEWGKKVCPYSKGHAIPLLSMQVG